MFVNVLPTEAVDVLLVVSIPMSAVVFALSQDSDDVQINQAESHADVLGEKECTNTI